jgi:hypothetical protein
LLKFDFFLPEFNILIEYDGEQHFISKENGIFNKEKLKEIQDRDEIKNSYCKIKNINLIRIPYLDFPSLNQEYIKEIINVNSKKYKGV